jgi:ABC-type sugar transport system ATPase subunit
MTNETLVEAIGVTRRYPGVTALSNVSIAVRSGTVHILAGENGAGKSTLVKVLTGTDRPNDGDVRILGRSVQNDPELFRRIGYVPQELNLFPHLTIAENLFMPFDQSGFRGGLLATRRLHAEAQKQLDRFTIRGRPDQQARELSISDQQLLMIARACSHRALDVLILDEPTSSLTVAEIERLFEIIRALRTEGKGVVFISHKTQEIFDIGDEITILRNGELVGHYPAESMDEQRLLALMAGREVRVDENFFPEAPPSDVVLDVRGLSGVDFDDVSFQLRRGEVLGFAGLVGAGRSEIMQTIFGYLPAKAGEATLDGERLRLGDTAASVRSGLVYISEERKLHGIFPMQSVLHNIGITLFAETTHGPFISSARERAAVQAVIDRFDVKTALLSQRIVNLSGGNQQKAIIGRALAIHPKVLILDEPTRGIDVRTKVELYRIVRDLANRGIGVIVISSDMLELRRCATRIICLNSGRIQGEYDSRTTSNEELVTAIFGKARETA